MDLIKNPENATRKQITKFLKNWTEDLNRHFSKEGIKMSNKYKKKWSASLVFRESQIKSTMNYHYTPIRISRLKLKRLIIPNHGRGNFWDSHILSYTPGGYVKWDSHPRKPFGSFLKKLDIHLPYDTAIPLLDVYPEKGNHTISILRCVHECF